MRDVSAEHQAAVEAGSLVARDFVWFVVRDWESGDPVYDGYWSDVGPISAAVVDTQSGGSTTRDYVGAFGLISISDIVLTSDLTVQTVTIKLSQCSSRLNDLLRGYDCRRARVEIHRGQFDPQTRVLVAPAAPRFVGFIDTAPIKTPPAGEEGDVTLTCASHAQELLRSNPDTRSHESQLRRTAPLYDDFYIDVGVVGGWTLDWGRESSKATGTKDHGGFG